MVLLPQDYLVKYVYSYQLTDTSSIRILGYLGVTRENGLVFLSRSLPMPSVYNLTHITPSKGLLTVFSAIELIINDLQRKPCISMLEAWRFL
jgi:hypothetical protein